MTVTSLGWDATSLPDTINRIWVAGHNWREAFGYRMDGWTVFAFMCGGWKEWED